MESSDKLETVADNCVVWQFVENQQEQQITQSDESNNGVNNDTTQRDICFDGQSKQIISPTECKSEPVENTADNDATEVIIDETGQPKPKCCQFECESDNGSESSIDSIDRIIKGVQTSTRKSRSLKCSSNDDKGETVETSKSDDITDTIDDSVKVASPNEQLKLCLNNVYGEESDYSFGLVVDESCDNYSTNEENDNESKKKGEDAQELEDVSLLILKEACAINSINVDDSICLPNVDNVATKDVIENRKLAVTESFIEQRSVSDDELVTSGRYGFRVKYENASALATSLSFGFENIRKSEKGISTTNKLSVCRVLTVSEKFYI